MILVILDFDLTITTMSIHKIIVESGKRYSSKKAQWKIVNDFKVTPTGSPEQWQKVFTTLLNSKEHRVAIASFNAFPHIIRKFLTDRIGLTPEQLKDIYIAKAPPNPEKVLDGKNKQIREIINHFKFDGASRNVILVDDEELNIDWAKEAKYSAIHISYLRWDASTVLAPDSLAALIASDQRSIALARLPSPPYFPEIPEPLFPITHERKAIPQVTNKPKAGINLFNDKEFGDHFACLQKAIADKNLSSPRVSGGLFAGQVERPLREMQALVDQISHSRVDNLKALLTDIADTAKSSYPDIYRAANQCSARVAKVDFYAAPATKNRPN